MSIIKSNELINEYLKQGVFSIEAQFMYGSNYTFFCDLIYQDKKLKTVYKPINGERPLWDFPNETLAGREVAAYLISEAAGWNFVPPTVYRKDGPEGPGSLQFFIEHDPEVHYFSFTVEDKQRLRPVALFDAMINNTDRKGGHLLIDEKNKLWVIDHGLCFHTDPKLRSVIWDFSEKHINKEEKQILHNLNSKLQRNTELYKGLIDFLSKEEIYAMIARIEVLLESNIFPSPSENRYSYPWPPV